MAIEIERKYLVKDTSWKAEVLGESRMVQGYLAVNNLCGIRVRIASEGATINIKSAGLDIRRMEFEYPIPMEDAEELISKFCAESCVAKTRYRVQHGPLLWEIDVFEGRNTGLIVAEVELRSETDCVELPRWVGSEVSGQARYMNNNLASHPYEAWPQEERHS